MSYDQIAYSAFVFVFVLGCIALVWTLSWFLGKSGYLLYARPEQRNMKSVAFFLLALIVLPFLAFFTFFQAVFALEALGEAVGNVVMVLFYSAVLAPIIGVRSGMKSNSK